ncbi:MAG: ADP-ribosylglycohydrolase family protein, partial [Mycetocola sp.]
MTTLVELDNAYLERVYAGVLGKVIGVYLGRPFEGWTYERIQRELGDIDYYVHDKLDVPLIVTDDDITGTFTFIRALADHGRALDITAEQIGQSWMNYLIENRTILWWGGLGNSTEHTAYLRLKSGIPAPRSGSRELNSTIVAEQIGAQIFVDGWAMVVPGEPRLAADLARRAGSVSHDGEALHAAAAWAAMEAEAFVSPDTHHLIDTALSVIPKDSTIAQVIRDVRTWHDTEPDWRATRERIDITYGYDKFGGNVHVVPNHALMHLGLLYGAGDFSRSLTIVNTAGWDTDCNSGNLGALLGLQLGLAGIDAGRDWRGPLADRLYLPSADGTRAISDAARESIELVNIARATRGEGAIAPKNGARFHFTLPGSTHGFTATGDGSIRSHDQTLQLNVSGQLIVTTPTFVPPDYRHLGYELIASPTLHSGQAVTAILTTPTARG